MLKIDISATQSRASFHSHIRGFEQREASITSFFFVRLIEQKKSISYYTIHIRGDVAYSLFVGLFLSHLKKNDIFCCNTMLKSDLNLSYKVLNKTSESVFNLELDYS